MSKRVVLSGMSKRVFVENPDYWVCQNVFFCRKSGFLGMSKRVCLSKILIVGYVKTCFLSNIRILGYVKTCCFVENPDFWVCQNVFYNLELYN